MNKILYKQPLPFQVAYSQNLKDFIFGMLEKDKSKRAFVIDLFPKFPQNYFQIKNPLDKENFKAYSNYKETMEKKRVTDSNKHKIHNQFDILKKRIQGNQMEHQKLREDGIKMIMNQAIQDTYA